MTKIIYKDLFVLLGMMIVFVILRFFVLNYLDLSSLGYRNIFLIEILSFSFQFPEWASILFGFGSLLLIYIIASKVSKNVAFISSLLYAISPWSIYLDLSGSIYTFLTFLLLTITFGVFLMQENKIVGEYLVIFGSMLLVLTNPLMVIILPILILLKANGLKIEPKIFYILSLVILLLVSFAYLNIVGFKNLMTYYFSLSQDIGIINSVNVLQGELNESNFSVVTKVFENKYFYYLQIFLLNLLKHVSPATYFVPQVKIFSFSFAAPIMTGLLVIFFIGLAWFLDRFNKNKLLLVLPFLFIPSALSRFSPDLERLIMLAPVIFFIISLGVNRLLITKKMRLVLVLFFVLIFTKSVLTFADIATRESLRLESFNK